MSDIFYEVENAARRGYAVVASDRDWAAALSYRAEQFARGKPWIVLQLVQDVALVFCLTPEAGFSDWFASVPRREGPFIARRLAEIRRALCGPADGAVSWSREACVPAVDSRPSAATPEGGPTWFTGMTQTCVG
jgi:hypothetical protein